MTFMSWANTILGLVMVLVAIYYFLFGRKLLRWIIFWNGMAGLYLFIVYLIVVYDKLCCDILTWQEVTEFLIKPVIFTLGFILLLNMILLGKRHDS